MFIKKKHGVVVFFSSIIIAVVFVTTLVGYSLYLQWLKDKGVFKYRNSISKLTAEIFKKDLDIYDINAKIADDGLFQSMPILRGSLKNNSEKIISSVLMEVSFIRPDGTVVYKDWFYPLGQQRSGTPILFPEVKQPTRNVLLPGESISFRRLLRSCPNEVMAKLSTKTSFAKNEPDNDFNLEYSIIGVSIL